MTLAVNPLVSVIIPAFDEADSITSVVQRTMAALGELGFSHEVIVVDDGSTDTTRECALNCGATLISHSHNLGKGAAIRGGLRKARGQILVTMDADGSHHPSEIALIIKPLLNGMDVVIGSRFLKKNGKITPKLNMLGNHIFNTLILLITRKRITDSQTGFRAFRKEVMKKLQLFSNGYEIETELTIKTLKNGFRVKEEPITCTKRGHGNSKISTLADGFSILRTILKANFA